MDLDEKMFSASVYIFLNNIYYQMTEEIPYPILYQLKNWQYDLSDIILPYCKDGYHKAFL